MCDKKDFEEWMLNGKSVEDAGIVKVSFDAKEVWEWIEKYGKQAMFNELSNVMSFSYSKKYVQDRLEELKP